MEENLAIEPVESKVVLARPPEVVLEEAHRAASALQRVITGKKKPVIFQGEQYLEFEDWQTVGKFYGLVVRTFEAVPVEIFEVKGAKARAEVIELRTGQVMGGAEAYCMRDEANWKEKPWFQLASMAQTRAGAKALRNVLAWVVVLAGYRPTPAEEVIGMQDTEPARTPPTRTEPHEADENIPRVSEAHAEDPASEAQKKAIHVLAGKLKLNLEDIYQSKGFPPHTNELTKKQASIVIEELKKLQEEVDREEKSN